MVNQWNAHSFLPIICQDDIHFLNKVFFDMCPRFLIVLAVELSSQADTQLMPAGLYSFPP